ncbi:MAG: IclR family transcriptional regulator [Propionibacteriaceae bacterium]|nr:IclR family transcriptional regulator [Propionibacteriaceae bacterium]
MAATPREGSSGAQSVGRALTLLRLVADSRDPVTAAALVSSCGLNRTTTWRLLTELESHGFVARLRDGGFALGPTAMMLGITATRRFDPLVRVALPSMELLREQTEETVILSVPYGGGVLTVEQLDSPQTVRLRNYLYEISPLALSSPGRALLASYPPEELATVLTASALPEGVTQADLVAFTAELARARRDGYATVVEDLAPGESGIAAAITVQGHVVGLLNVSGPSTRLSLERMRAVAPMLKEACARVAGALAEVGSGS